MGTETSSTSSRPLSLVTGASGGIGPEIARELAGRGYDVVVNGRSAGTDDVAAELRGQGAEAHPVRADLAEDLRLIDLNVKTVVHLAERAVVDMIPRHGGRILMTSSISATQPTPYETTYGPSRAFVHMFAEALREEVADRGISVTALLPGPTDSDLHANAGMGDTVFGDNSWKNDRRRVARQGVEAMLAGKDTVVGGDHKTKRTALVNRLLPERFKAAGHARVARPGSR